MRHTITNQERVNLNKIFDVLRPYNLGDCKSDTYWFVNFYKEHSTMSEKAYSEMKEIFKQWLLKEKVRNL